MRYSFDPSGESASKPNTPFSVNVLRTARSVVLRRMKLEVALIPMVCTTKALPSWKSPPMVPFGVSWTVPYWQGTVRDIVALPSVPIASIRVAEPALVAMKWTEPSMLGSPLPPWTAIGPGYAADADGTSASAPASTSRKPIRRTIAPPYDADGTPTPPAPPG